MIINPERFLERSKWKNILGTAHISVKESLNGVKRKLKLADVYTNVFSSKERVR